LAGEIFQSRRLSQKRGEFVMVPVRQGCGRFIPGRPLEEIGLLVILALCGVMYTSQVAQCLDIGLADETFYLEHGLRFPAEDLQRAEDGALYSLWYAGLAQVWRDPVHLYDANLALTCVLPVLAFFLLLRSASVPRPWAFLAGVVMLVAGFNLPVWPRVNHFTVAILMVGLGLSLRVRESWCRWAIIASVASISSYARPELFLSALVASAATGFLVWRKWANTKSPSAWWAMLALTALWGILAVVFGGAPVGGGGRSMLAFSQHYALNWVRIHADPRNPWVDYEDIVRANFGEAASPGQAFLANPAAFLTHVFQNVVYLPVAGSILLRVTYPFPQWTIVGLVIVLALLGMSGWQLRRGLGGLRGILRLWPSPGWPHLLMLAVFLFPSVIALCVLGPRNHYMVIPGFLLGFELVRGFVLAVEKHRALLRPAASSFCGWWAAVAVILVLKPMGGPASSYSQDSVRNAISLLREAASAQGGQLPLMDLQRGGLLGFVPKAVLVAPPKPGENFFEFLEANKVGAIAWGPRFFETYPSLRDDAELRTFLASPEQFLFTKTCFLHAEEVTLFVRIIPCGK
jgi:hypothetical protein